MISKYLYSTLLPALCCIFSGISFSAKAQHSFISLSFTGGASKYNYIKGTAPDAGSAYMSSIRFGAYIIPDLLYISTGPSFFSLSDKIITTDYNNPIGGVSKMTFKAQGIAHTLGIGLSAGKRAVRFIAGADFSFNQYNYKTQFERKNGIGLWPHAEVLISLSHAIQLGVTGQAGFLTSPNNEVGNHLKASYYGAGISLRFKLS